MKQAGVEFFFLVAIIGKTVALESSESHDDTKRKLTSSFNCTANGANVGYTRAEGKHDTLHYVSSTYGIPTLLVARTDVTTFCHVECDSFVANTSKSVKFSSNPHFVYSVSFTKIFEYNDVKDKADLRDSSVKDWRIIDLKSLKWLNVTAESNLTTHTLTWKAENSSSLKLQKKGSLSFRIETYDKEGRNRELPRLLFNGNNSHLFFTLDNLLPSFENSRYALEVSLISADKNQHSERSTINLHKSLDDEHTPGVFDTVAWTAGGRSPTDGAYLQWKPVCYINPKPSIQESTSAKYYEVRDVNVTAEDFGLAMAYFGLDTLASGKLQIQSTNISFGLTKDKFYNAANYTEWTFSVGYGTPPQDEISPLIITIISVGLGIPVVLVVIGAVCACVRKKKSDQSGFTSSYTAIQ